MMVFCRGAVLFALMALGMAGGCRHAAVKKTPADTAGEPTIGHIDEDLAEALANFGVAILREGLRDDRALENFERSAELAPEQVRVFFYQAIHHATRGETDQALAVMAKACDLNPDSDEACLLLANLAQSLHRPDKAFQAVNRAISINPTRAANHVQLALFHAGRQNEKRAIATLEKALPLVDDQLPILRLLGDMYATSFGTPGERDSPETERALNLGKAVDYLEQAERLPQDELRWEYRNKLGDLYVLNRQYAAAARVFEELLDRNTDDLALRKKLALCYILEKNNDQAAEQLRIIAARHPDNPDIHFELGELYESVGNIDAAIASYKAARDTAPDIAAPYLKLGQLLARDNLDDGISVLEDGRKMLPGDMAIMDLLARLYIQGQRGQEALDVFDELHDILRENNADMLSANFWVGYATAAQQGNMPERAAELYEKALAHDPGFLNAYISLALLHAGTGKAKQAMEVMHRAQDSLPDNPRVWYFTGIVANQAGKYAPACKAFQRTEELVASGEPGSWTPNAEFYFYYGAASERIGDYEKAAYLLQRAVELEPDYADALNYLAYMWAEQSVNLPQALEYIQRALALDPENGAYLDTLGWIYFKKGRLDDAAVKIRKALALIPDDPVIREHYGDIYHAQGQEEEARHWWLKSWQQNPDNPELLEKMLEYGIEPPEYPAPSDSQ